MKIDNKRLLSDSLHELLIQEVDFTNSEINTFIDNLTINIILKSLSKNKRVEFYRLVSESNYEQAQVLIKKEIPDFNKQILKNVKDYFENTL